MAAEVYRKVGRGGAGNYYSNKDVENVQNGALTDIEAQQPPLSRTTSSDSTSQNPSQPPPEYLHTGRGGAGNWVQPSDLTSSGLAQTSDPIPTSTTPSSTTQASKRVIGASKPTYRGGRGGAGNYRDFEEEEKLRKEEEENKRLEMEKQVTRDVEMGLQRPGKAYGAPEGKGGAFEMGDMN